MSAPYGALARWKQFQPAMQVSDDGVKTFWKLIKDTAEHHLDRDQCQHIYYLLLK